MVSDSPSYSCELKLLKKEEEAGAISAVPFSSLVMLKATTTWITHPLSQLFFIPVPSLLAREAEDHFHSPSRHDHLEPARTT